MNENALYEVIVQWNYSKYLKANKLLMKNSIARINFLICFLLLINVVLVMYEMLKKDCFCMSGCITTALCILALLYVPQVFKNKWKTGWETSPDPKGFSQTFEFYNDYYESFNLCSSKKTSYTKIVKIVEKDEFIFFFDKSNTAMTIPKEDMNPEALKLIYEKSGITR